MFSIAVFSVSKSDVTVSEPAGWMLSYDILYESFPSAELAFNLASCHIVIHSWYLFVAFRFYDAG